MFFSILEEKIFVENVTWQLPCQQTFFTQIRSETEKGVPFSDVSVLFFCLAPILIHRECTQYTFYFIYEFGSKFLLCVFNQFHAESGPKNNGDEKVKKKKTVENAHQIERANNFISYTCT